MFHCLINLARIALLANIITLIASIAYPSAATTFAFIDIDTPKTENLLLSPQVEEDPDEEPGTVVDPN
ncbi:MAG: hypothetical protein QNJ74_30400 [Trichodesmium sp. MO_231.B1]|nr:hypothetical protein [Trichodesmium sp. MO_231.B1]